MPRRNHRDNTCVRSGHRIEPRVALQSATGGRALLADFMAADSHRLVTYRDSPLRYLCLGPIFLVGEMSAGYRVVVLLFGSDLRYHRVWRSRLAERVADAWPNRGIHRHSDVWTFHRIFLYRCE